ncbi:hypothetical protein ACFUJ0_10510 [Streptomyces sp. NPDC057242]|uniref:hypothetical protein n=1 Tax=unclassified Streptomyces TaxID=2593676 RepID=UPI003641CFC8
MSTVPEMSGVDLARQALLAAREAAKKNGAARQKPKRRTGTAVRRDGREPLGLGAAISMMMTERGLVAPAAGGSVLAQWKIILAAAGPEEIVSRYELRSSVSLEGDRHAVMVASVRRVAEVAILGHLERLPPYRDGLAS